MLLAMESSAQLQPPSPLQSLGPWREVWGAEQGTGLSVSVRQSLDVPDSMNKGPLCRPPTAILWAGLDEHPADATPVLWQEFPHPRCGGFC